MIQPDFIIEESPDQDNERPHSRISLYAGERALKSRLETVMAETLSWHESEPKAGQKAGQILDFNTAKRQGAPPESRAEALHKGIRITTGVGKSEQIRRMIADFVPEAKRRGLPHRVLFLVPTHRLGDEALRKMPANVTTALWQGRQATSIGSEEPLCLDLEAVKAALKIGADVEKTACRKGRRGEEPIQCPFYESCGYQKQKAPAKAADVVFAAHEIGFQPPDILGGDDFGLVVIDEAFWQDGITDARIAISGLDHELTAFPVRDAGINANALDTAHLTELIGRLQDGLDALPDGYVTKAAIAAEGLLPPGKDYEPGSCAKALKYEWRRKVEVVGGLLPGADAATRQKAVEKYQFLGQIPRRAAMWHALDELLTGDADATGRLRIETETTTEGSIRWLRVLGRKDLHEKVAGLPLIHADATMPLDLVRLYLPRIEMALDLDVETPHMRVTQVVGLPVGKSSIVPKAPGERKGKKSGAWTETGEEAEARVSSKRQRLADFVRHRVRGRKGLTITYKDAEADFRQDGIEAAHFGAIEGIDRWRDVDVMVTIGRPLPSPRDIERCVAALYGEPLTIGGMIHAEAGIAMTSGPDRLLQHRIYENSHAEIVRRAVVEAAIVQAVGRVRGTRRTAANPVEVYMVLHDTVTPLPVDEVVDFASLEPDAVDEMILGGLVPQMPADAAKLFPKLFPSREAAKKAYRRAGLNVERWSNMGTSPYREFSIRECPHVNRVRYQLTGPRQRPRLALYDPEKFPDIRATLEAALGPLVAFEVLAPEPRAEPEAHPTAQAEPAQPTAQAEPENQAEPEPQPRASTEARPHRAYRQAYQPDLFGAPVVDLDEYRSGKLPAELAMALKATYRARGQSQGQFACEIGLSRPQLCNALRGRFGLSHQAADRLRSWIGAG